MMQAAATMVKNGMNIGMSMMINGGIGVATNGNYRYARRSSFVDESRPFRPKRPVKPVPFRRASMQNNFSWKAVLRSMGFRIKRTNRT